MSTPAELSYPSQNEDRPVPLTPRRAGLQPLLHDLISCVDAPLLALSPADGQIRPGGAHGLYEGDVRLVSTLVLRVDGGEPEAIDVEPLGASAVRLTSLVRTVGDDLPDPSMLVERLRRIENGHIAETVTVRSSAACAAVFDVELEIGCDAASMTTVKTGGPVAAVAAEAADAGLRFVAADLVVSALGIPAPERISAADGVLAWTVRLPAGATWSVTVIVMRAAITRRPDPQITAAGHRASFVPLGYEGAPPWSLPVVRGDVRLADLLSQSLTDLEGLLLRDPLGPRDCFLAAGSPWFLTLFGRDSIWAARMLLPLGTDLAAGTLRTLARRQGRTDVPDTEEQPGKILHEARRDQLDLSPDLQLPPVYFGTVDATPLWVCLLADAWRWGMPEAQVEALLPDLEGALSWLVTYADADGDGFLEYVDHSGHGLANQGWKDSGDSIQWADGRLADPPIALCEVQAYAHEAAVAGADLLDAFGRPGSDRLREWADALRTRFRGAFWVDDPAGPYPAVALDRDKRRVDSLTSNIGHLLGTGLLDDTESALVAGRLASADLNSGFGLRTLSAASAGFGPLRYHGGSVWAHDTAIAVLGLARTGHDATAWALIDGLLDAAPAFGHRLPELYAGDARVDRGRPMPYPAACRPQAWSAASAMALVTAILGLRPDAPAGRLEVGLLGRGAGGVEVSGVEVSGMEVNGLRLAGEPVSLRAESGRIVVLEAPAALTVADVGVPTGAS